jgi:hypothetical protein
MCITDGRAEKFVHFGKKILKERGHLKYIDVDVRFGGTR